MKRPKWEHVDGVDEHHEIEILPDTFLAVHRVEGAPWSAMLFETGAEDVPFRVMALRSKSTAAAKREALRRVVSELSKIVHVLESVRAA